MAAGTIRPRRKKAPCEGSADVDRPLLSYRLGGSVWLGGQLKNRSLLTLTNECQQQDLAVWKFQRIVMRHRLFFVDLPKDGCRAIEHVLAPAKWTDRPGGNFASKGQLGSR
jgi:hypothetical protein